MNETVDTAPETEVADTQAGATVVGRPDAAPELVDNSTMDTTLLPPNDIERYRDEWRAVQAGFVDDPQAAVRDADKLLEQVVDTVTSRLAERRTELSKDDGQETEHLRQALRSYRSLFDQLIGV
jgi:hypothetical protein